MDPALLLAGLVGAALAGLAGAVAVWRVRVRRARAERRRMATAPVGLWHRPARGRGAWTLDGAGADLLDLDPARAPRPDAVVARLRDSHRAPLQRAVEALVTEGAPFDLTADTADEAHTLEFRGRRSGGDALVWITDVSAASRLAESYAEADIERAMLRGVLDRLPLPVWWRSQEDLQPVGGNTAHGSIVATDTAGGPARPTDIAGTRGRQIAEKAARTGVAQSESVHLVVGGERRLMDITESPVDPVAGVLVGYARDMTELETLQERLAEHIAAHDEVLERLDAAIAIFGADRRLSFYNAAYVRLWNLPRERLDEGPALGQVLEMLRERRALPELVDFPAFKRTQDQLFTALFESREELLHLPDERTIRETVSPHPRGGLVFVYEDVTDRVALERSHNTLTAVQRLTLDSLHEGVCVFGPDGRLRLFNDSFARLFDLESGTLAAGPHIAELAEQVRDVLPPAADWAGRKQRLVLAVSEPQPKSGRMELTNGRIVDYAYVPLPDGQCLLLYLDVTDSVRVERALTERAAALENADLLKSQFISSISYELRSPLNAILGFTELLQAETYGALNPRQSEQLGHIHAASLDLATLVSDVLDLAALQAGYLAIERGPVDLNALLADVRATAEDEAEAGAIAFAADLAHDLGRIDGDANRLRQALRRVLSNAIAFAPARGRVTLSAERTDEGVRVMIADGGEGVIDSERFRMPGADDQMQEPVGQMTGAGVGLALCKNLMELHGGALEIDPATERGAAVICTLPVAAA